ncbi:MAG: peptidoglycan-binding protein [Caulobacteraceae bacterium]|nr:peptidoglycan-binding protein [Caulobacter sp.]
MRVFTVLGAGLLAGAMAAPAFAGEEPPPPGAHPGQCFAKVVEPARTRTVLDHVLVAPGRVDTRVIPVRRHWESRPVLLEPERRERFVIPATYRDVWETVVVRPATVQVSTLPAEYRDVPETVMVAPARRYWRRAEGVPQYGPYWPGQTRVEPTGEVVCLVEEPAQYRTVWRHVCVRPEQQVQTPVPAVIRQVARRVIDQPAREEERVIPARFGQQQVEVVDAPERVERIDVPPVYRDVPRQEVVEPAHTRWLPTVCAAPPPPPPCPTACALAPPSPPPPLACGEDDACGAPPPPGAGYREPDEFAGAAGDTRVRHRRDWRRRDGAAPSEPAASVNPVADMERALAARGYYKGPVDGLFTPAAGAALHRFQRDNGLAQGPLTHESARRLGVDR